MTQTVTYTTNSPADTEAFAAAIASSLRGGEVIELASDLGGGKTTFVRGLAAGLGSADRVASPTFTIGKVYQAPRFAIHHFDFYRLTEPGLAAFELHDLLGDPEAIIVVEWAAVVADVLPDERLSVVIVASGEQRREITCTVPPALAYITAALQERLTQ